MSEPRVGIDGFVEDIERWQRALVALAVSLAACGPATSHGRTETATMAPVHAPTAGSNGEAAADVLGCAADSLCLTVVNMGDPPDGKVAAFWVPSADDLDRVSPEKAYETDFSASMSTVVIPLSQLAAPSEPLRTCKHVRDPAKCTGPDNCPCASGIELGFAYVVVHPGGDFDESAIYGTSKAVIGFATNDHSPEDILYDTNLGDIAPDGMRQGIHLYDPVRADPDSFEEIVPATTQSFELEVCAPSHASACEIEVNLM